MGKLVRTHGQQKGVHVNGRASMKGKVMNSNVRPRGTDEAKVIQVIETISVLGAGTENDPARALRQYWSLDGELLARQDSLSATTADLGKCNAVTSGCIDCNSLRV